MRIWLFMICSSLAMVCACAPSLRAQDVNALRHVQSDIETRHAAASGGDKIVLKVTYCEINAVIVAAGQGSGSASAIACGGTP